MNPSAPHPFRLGLARLRAWLSPTQRKNRRQVAAAEQAQVVAFAAMRDLAGRGDVQAVAFTGNGAEVVLKDGRRFGYDPRDRLERLYSLPVTGEFERKETEWVRMAVQPGSWCVDAGGSFGWYAVLLAQATGPSGQVHVFEPIPRTVEVLQANLRRNRCENVKVHAVALADAPGTADLFVPDVGVSGSLRLHTYRSAYETFACPVETLDLIAAREGWSRLDFLKADIEGAEWALLRGAEQCLARWRPSLLLEIQADSTRRFGHEPGDVFRWLAERGYVGGWVDNDGRLNPARGDETAVPDYNFIFVPREKASRHAWRAQP